MAKITNWFQALRKTTEWRIIAFAIDFTVIFLFTGEVKTSTGIAAVSAFIKFITNVIWIKRRFS